MHQMKANHCSEHADQTMAIQDTLLSQWLPAILSSSVEESDVVFDTEWEGEGLHVVKVELEEHSWKTEQGGKESEDLGWINSVKGEVSPDNIDEHVEEVHEPSVCLFILL